MHRVLFVLATAAVATIGLLTPPAAAQMDPGAVIIGDPRLELVPRPGPLEPPSEGCIVPALAQPELPCTSPRSPGDTRGLPCTLPVVYLGGTPGPCPERRHPPKSRIIPVGPAALSR